MYNKLKIQSEHYGNIVTNNNDIGTHRADIDMSAQYAAMEDVFIQIGKGDKDDPVFVMDGADKVCLDSFMEARNNALLWGKTDVDVNGNA